MTLLKEELEIGLEASFLPLDNKLMKLFKTSYQLSVSPGSVPHLCFHSHVVIILYWESRIVLISLLLHLYSLAVIFGAGLVTSLSPCTLSVLPLTLGYIGKHYFFSFVSLLIWGWWNGIGPDWSWVVSLSLLVFFMDNFSADLWIDWNHAGAFGSGKSRAQVITSYQFSHQHCSSLLSEFCAMKSFSSSHV